MSKRKNYIILIVCVIAIAISFSALRRLDYYLVGGKGITKDKIAFEIVNKTAIVTGYKGKDKNLIIPREIYGYPVTEIDRNFECVQISSVVIPEGVTKIGGSAFGGQRDLTEVSLPSSLREISYSAFAFCGNNQGRLAVQLPEKLEIIGHGAFAYSALEEVIIPKSVKRIETRTFTECRSLKKVTFLGDIEIVDMQAFSSCPELSGVVFNGNVGMLKNNAFGSCEKLEYIFAPNHVDQVEGWAFDSTGWLKNQSESQEFVVFADYLIKYTGNDEIVTIPSGIKSIAPRTFEGNSTLKKVIISPEIVNVDKGAFDKAVFGVLTIEGEVNSAAERYAENNGIAFQDIDKAKK